MGLEIERKFLVKDNSFKQFAIKTTHIIQGYILKSSTNSVRVRLYDNKAVLTIKGPSNNGISRFEWEMPINYNDAKELLHLCDGGVIEKVRYIVPIKDSSKCFEVDEFLGSNQGLVMAEIELETQQEQFPIPLWIGQEVTGNPHYYNSYLIDNPYIKWPKI